MITLITGLPGNGKTLYALVYIKNLAEKEGRQVWYHGIKGLKLDWQQIPVQIEKINGREVEVPQWWLCPANSIVIIDEAQNCGFGVRPRGTCPEWGQMLETHRHLGIDVVFITQDPSLVDAHDRKLIELHFHVMRTFGMARAVIHEFRPVRENVAKSRKGSIQHRWAFPKSAYEWYTSAEAHTHKVRIPAKVFVFIGLPFLIIGLGWFAWVRYLDPHKGKPSPDGQPGQVSVQSAVAAAPAAKLTAAQYVEAFSPRVAGLHYTAPVYDDVTRPVEAPYPAACVTAKGRCQCYSQQATRLDVPQSLCQSIVDGGFFVAWKQPDRPAAPRVVEPSRSEPASAGSLGGVRAVQAAPAYDGAIDQTAKPRPRSAPPA